MLEKLKELCNKKECFVCPLFSAEESECILCRTPSEWDIAEIEKRIGGKEND